MKLMNKPTSTKKSFFKRFWWSIFVLVPGIFIVLYIVKPPENLKTEPSQEAPLITANFVDPITIAAITKFRSCSGHVVVPQTGDEPRSNMKHYFYLKKAYKQSPKQVELYAPFDGYILDIRAQEPEDHGKQEGSSDITLGTNKGISSKSDWGLTFLHTIPKNGLKEGDPVKAGEMIAYVALDVPPYFSFDVVYGKNAMFPKKIDGWSSPYAALDSVFNHMSDEVLAEYLNVFSLDSKDDFIFSSNERKARPCQYQASSYQFDSSDPQKEMIGKLE